jgi:APA family basic amino acid/polyamine antiporter
MTEGKMDATNSRPPLSLWDAISIIIGIVVGSTIFRSPPLIFGSVASAGTGLAAWVLGGALSLVGALCYAELACSYPQDGGDYVYLHRAFGSVFGFLFGWSHLTVILPAMIGAIAFVFADYAVLLLRLREDAATLAAALAILGLAAINALGIAAGKRTQNLLTLAKLLGLGGIVIAGFGWGRTETATAAPAGPGGFGLAMILVLYAYGGWNDLAFVTAELRSRRHIVLALVAGTAVITLIYLAVNIAYLRALGFAELRLSKAVAADVLRLPLGPFGEKAACLLVMVCALGAINGMILTGARLYAVVGRDYRPLAWLARGNTRRGAPLGALAALALSALALIAAVGPKAGRDVLDFLLQKVGMEPLPWQKYEGGFNTLVAGTSPVFWGFFLLSGLSLFVLRQVDATGKRPFAVPLFPLLPLIFCGSCAFMLYQSLSYAGNLALLGGVPLLLGLIPYAMAKNSGESGA